MAIAFLNRNRMLADGVPYPDMTAAEAYVESGGSWYQYWYDRGSEYEAAGDEALARGRTQTAGSLLWLASLSVHYGQYMWYHDVDEREAGQRRKTSLYERAAPHLDPPAIRLEIPFEDTVIPGYLRQPRCYVSGASPCVVLIGGLESTKEESLLFENLCLERGLATFAFDGPGQGEMFFTRKLTKDFERYTSAVVDALFEREDIDADRVAVLGRSLGGYYALRSAACDDRFKACVAWGVTFDLSERERLTPHHVEAFLYVSGLSEETPENIAEFQSRIDLADVASNIRCPVYLQHGGRDYLFSLDHVRRVEDAVTQAPVEVDVEEFGDHCLHNMASIARPRMVDWLAERLGPTS